MRRSIIMSALSALLASSFLLNSCKKGGDDLSMLAYSKDNDLYAQAMKMAREEHPRYFEKIKKFGIEDEVVAIRVFPSKGECVYIYNTSSIIIHERLPMYCFDSQSRKFLSRI